MANALTDVQNTFLLFDAQYSVLLAGCTSQPQREALIDQYAAAQLNYQKALNATLEDDDAQVAALSQQLKAANTQVVQATANLGNIARVIDDITTAVSLGAKLVAMV
jgi:outer membrane murein-binding lipoprotein Lpp